VKVRRQVFVSVGIIGAMLAVTAWAWGRLPTKLAVRWNLHGDPVGYMDRDLSLTIMPAVAVVLTVFFVGLPALMPARSRLERSAVAWTAVWMVALADLLFSQVMMIAANLGAPLDIPRVCAVGAAVVIFVVGNWLGKLRYNFLIGVRTPWTLADERVWDKTHRFAGRLLVLFAILLAAATLALPASAHANVILYSAMIVSAAAPLLAAIVYSALITRPAPPSA
jgi:uncharacterized membrane protein